MKIKDDCYKARCHVWPCETPGWCSPVTWDTWHHSQPDRLSLVLDWDPSSSPELWVMPWSHGNNTGPCLHVTWCHTLVIVLSEHRRSALKCLDYLWGVKIMWESVSWCDGIQRISEVLRTLWGITGRLSQNIRWWCENPFKHLAHDNDPVTRIKNFPPQLT